MYVYLRAIEPQSVPIGCASFQGVMIGIHRTHLATVIPGLVRMLIVHIVRDPDLGENHWMVPHIPQALVS